MLQLSTPHVQDIGPVSVDGMSCWEPNPMLCSSAGQGRASVSCISRDAYMASHLADRAVSPQHWQRGRIAKTRQLDRLMPATGQHGREAQRELMENLGFRRQQLAWRPSPGGGWTTIPGPAVARNQGSYLVSVRTEGSLVDSNGTSPLTSLKATGPGGGTELPGSTARQMRIARRLFQSQVKGNIRCMSAKTTTRNGSF